MTPDSMNQIPTNGPESAMRQAAATADTYAAAAHVQFCKLTELDENHPIPHDHLQAFATFAAGYMQACAMDVVSWSLGVLSGRVEQLADVQRPQ